ncbi:MAG: D-alanyl-D-alanine carboxypeptidase family protein [Chakrabartia sp.]
MKNVLIAAALLFGAAAPAYAAAPPFETEAPVAYMVDLSSGAVLYAKDADRRMPPASMAKMMTAHIVFDMLKKGELKLDQKFKVRPETWKKWHGSAAGSTMFLSPDEEVSVENLLHGVVTLSGNDACVVLAEGIAGTEEAFVARMNAEAKRIGMTKSQFGTSNGWPDEGRTQVTARDLATLAVNTLQNYPDLYRKFYQQKEFRWGKTMGKGEDIVQANRNPILGRVPGADGLKTGHTAEAGYGFTGSAEQNGRRLVMVVAGLGSFNARATESVKFMDWGFKAWSVKPLFAKGAEVEKIEISGGYPSKIALIAPQQINVTYPGGTASPHYTTAVRPIGSLEAPITKGQHIADLVITTPDAPPGIVPLVAGEDVQQAGFFKRLWLAFLSIFGL